MAPTMAPNGTTPADDPVEEHMETTTIVAIVLGVVAAVGLMLFIGIWYITRRKPDIIIDEEFADSVGDDIVMVAPPNEDPRVLVPGQSASFHQQGASYMGQPVPPETHVGEKQDSASYKEEMDESDAPDSNRDGSL
jgi:hypothetical protein